MSIEIIVHCDSVSPKTYFSIHYHNFKHADEAFHLTTQFGNIWVPLQEKVNSLNINYLNLKNVEEVYKYKLSQLLFLIPGPNQSYI